MMSSKKCENGFTWSKEATTRLITLYELHPDLYCIRLADYHNKNVRQAQLNEISEELNRNFLSNLTVTDIQKKIHGLRTTYFNELNKVKKSKISGASTDDIYVPKWWCFELLHFLNDTSVVVEKGESNIIENEVDNSQVEEGEVLFDGPAESLMSPVSEESSRSTSRTTFRDNEPVKRPHGKKSRKEDPVHDLLSSATSALKNLSENNYSSVEIPAENRNEIFGKMVSAEMNTITNEAVLDDLKENIIVAIFQAKRKLREPISLD